MVGSGEQWPASFFGVSLIGPQYLQRVQQWLPLFKGRSLPACRWAFSRTPISLRSLDVEVGTDLLLPLGLSLPSSPTDAHRLQVQRTLASSTQRLPPLVASRYMRSRQGSGDSGPSLPASSCHMPHSWPASCPTGQMRLPASRMTWGMGCSCLSVGYLAQLQHFLSLGCDARRSSSSLLLPISSTALVLQCHSRHIFCLIEVIKVSDGLILQ